MRFFKSFAKEGEEELRLLFFIFLCRRMGEGFSNCMYVVVLYKILMIKRNYSKGNGHFIIACALSATT